MAKRVSKRSIFLLAIIAINLAIAATAYFSTPILSYQLNEDNTSYSVSDVSPFAVNITIPSHYKDLPITKVADKAFSYSAWLRRVSFAQDSRTQSIGESAFEGCRALKSITLPDGLISIGSYAFANCSKLAAITIPDSVQSIGGYAFADRFYSSMGLAEVTFGQDSQLKSIGYYAFKQCRKLTSISLPSSVLSIETGAFQDCDSLKSITIPASTISLGYAPFSNCSCLESIDVEEGNTIFKSIDGVLFRLFATELLAYPIGNSRKSYTVPESVRIIKAKAFSNCGSLQSITMPDKVWSIGESAFEGCSNLSSITVGRTLPPELERYAFAKVSSQLKIYVPPQSLDEYKSAPNWLDYSSCIYAKT